jgi:ATP-dependent RNA helicase DeaD
VLRFFESPSTIVFCNTRNAVRHLQAALLERGFSVVALSGELTQNERTQALQGLRDGRARVCVATDVAARGIDLPNLDLVIHADLPNDAEVLQHRSGRTGRAGRKGVSVLLVPPARRRRAELLLNLAGIEAIWEAAPQADDIRKLDRQRLLHDPLFAEESSDEDRSLAQALLAERSPEQIAAALARLYSARLPSPEDLVDPGQGGSRVRDDRGRGRDAGRPRGDDADAGPRSTKPKKSRPRDGMAEGSVWFRAGIGRRKNAEARWLLPMICRRGGIDKNDIGTIRVLDTTTEFEISARVADEFTARVSRPDKEDNIRIEALAGAPQEQAPDTRPRAPRREDHETDRRPRAYDKPRDDSASKSHRAPRREGDAKSSHETRPRAKPWQPEKSAHAGKPPRDRSPAAKPAFDKKAKKKAKPHRRG